MRLKNTIKNIQMKRNPYPPLRVKLTLRLSHPGGSWGDNPGEKMIVC